MAFDHSRRRWFGTCSCKPVPRGRPSSVKQLHTLGPPRPSALVAHNHPHICQVYDVGPNYLVIEYMQGSELKGPIACRAG